MNFCTSCGAACVVGRFCTNCGAPITPSTTPGTAVGSVSDTAERPAVRSATAGVEPPPAHTSRLAAGSRYPLFADEVHADAEAHPESPPTPHRDARRRLPPWLPVLAAAVVLAMVAGVWLLRGEDSSDDASGTQADAASSASEPPAETADGDPTAPSAPDGSPADLAAESTATGPAPLRPGRDLSGRTVAYPPANMLDDDLATAYRVRGDASGETLTFTLPSEAEISEVGLVNGYAKQDTSGSRTVDWYPLNRKILKVEWVFDDGSTVSQDLRTEPVLQTIVVDKVRTSTISLRILEVSPPGSGALGKNATAISDVLLRGTP